MAALELQCPAKLNLLLAVTGRRPDGFHDLVSLVAPLAWGDTLRVEAAAKLSLACDDPAVPVDDTNLVLKAAAAFRAATGWSGGARFTLTKRIPHGAGLGGGSSDAATALVLLNALAGTALTPAALAPVAAAVGSDCALFLSGGPVVIRGRGERVEPLTPEVRTRLRGNRVLVFKPSFGIATPWAYGRLAAEAPASYLPAAPAEARLAELMQAARGEPMGPHLFNSFEAPAFRKFVALPVLLGRLQVRFGLAPRMSGSGSACFAFLPDDGPPVAAVEVVVREAWGESAVVVDTKLL